MASLYSTKYRADTSRPWPDSEIPGVVSRSVTVTALNDEQADGTQKWRLSWNNSPINGWGWGRVNWDYIQYTSDPNFTYSMSDDLQIQGQVVYKLIDKTTGQTVGSVTRDPWLHDWNSQVAKTSTTTEYLYHFGSAAASNCLNGGGRCGDALQLDNSESGRYKIGQLNENDLRSASKSQSFVYKTYGLSDSNQNRKLTVTAEFTTKRTASATNPWDSSRTWVMAGFKSYDYYTFENRVAYKVYDSGKADRDHDALPDKYEAWIGSDPDNPDTDGDGRPDGLSNGNGGEVQKLQPQVGGWGDDSTKIVGSDPTVGKQARPLNSPAELTAGTVISGKAQPNATVVIQTMVNGVKTFVGSARSDAEGNYSITVGEKFKNMGPGGGVNKFGNAIALDGNGNPITEPAPNYTTLARSDAVLEVWSDGWDGRPLFSVPESVPWGLPVVPGTTTSDADSSVTPAEATAEAAYNSLVTSIPKANVQTITVTLRDSGGNLVSGAAQSLTLAKASGSNGATFPVTPSGDVFTKADHAVFYETAPGVYVTYVSATSATEDSYVVSVNDNGRTVTLNGPDAGANADPASHLIFTVPEGLPTQAEVVTPSAPIANQPMTDASLNVTTNGGTPVASGSQVWVKLPGQEGLTPVTLGAGGTATLPAFTPTDGDATITVYADPNGDKQIGTKTLELTVGKPSVSGDHVSTAMVTQNGAQVGNEQANRIKVTLVDAAGNALSNVDPDEIVVARSDGSGEGLTIKAARNLGGGEYTIDVASTKAGDMTFSVTAQDVEITKNLAMAFTPGPLSAANSTATVTRNNAAASSDETNIITVSLKDALGNPISGKEGEIGLQSTPANWSKTAVTEVKGKPGTYEIAISGTQQRTDSAQVMVGGTAIGEPVSVTFKTPPADPSQSTVTVTCPEGGAVADGESTCEVTITLKTRDGVTIEDDRSEALGLTLPEGLAQRGSIEFDEITHTYTAHVASTKAGSYAVGATSGGKALTGTTPAQEATFKPGPLAKADQWKNVPGVDGVPAVQAGTEVSGITVHVTDKDGNDLPAGSDVWVAVPGLDGRVHGVVGENGIAALDPFTPKVATDAQGKPTDGAPLEVFKEADGGEAVAQGPAIGVVAGPMSPLHSQLAVTTGKKPVGGDPHTATLTLMDKYGNKILADSGAEGITLAATDADGATAQVTALTNNGNGTFTATVSSTKAGDFTVTATKGLAQIQPVAPSGNAVASFEAGGPSLDATAAHHSTYTVTCPDGGATANGEATCTVTLTLVDAEGNPITTLPEGVSVTAGEGGSEDAKVTGPDASGNVYTWTITSEKAGDYTVTATIGGTDVPAEGETTAHFVAGPFEPTNLGGTTFTVSPGEKAVSYEGGSHTVTVKVTDAKGNAVDLPASDVTVSVSDLEGATLTPVEGEKGTYTATLTSSARGTATVSVTVQGTAITAKDGKNKAAFTGGTAVSAELTASRTSSPSAPMTAGDTVTLTYTPKDAQGQPTVLPDAPETITLNVPGYSEPVTLTKQDDGTYSAEVQMKKAGANQADGTTVGPVTITTTSDAPLPATMDVYVKAAGVDPSTSTATVILDGAAYALPDEDFKAEYNKVRVTLRDQWGNPIMGQPVHFGRPTDDHQRQTETVTSDANGNAVLSLQLKLNTNPEDSKVSVTEGFRLGDSMSVDRGPATNDTVTMTFVRPAIDRSHVDTWFMITPNAQPVIADGVDSYTVTVSLHSEATQDEPGGVALKDRAGSLLLTGLAEGVTASAFTSNEDGTYTATLTAKSSADIAQNVGVSVPSGALANKGGHGTSTFPAPFVANTLNDAKTTFVVKKGGEEVSSVTAGDEVTYVYTPLNAHGHAVPAEGTVTVTVTGPDGKTKEVTLTEQPDGSYVSEPQQMTQAGNVQLEVKDAGTSRKTAELAVEPGPYSAEHSTLTFTDAKGDPIPDTGVQAGENNATLTFTPRDAFGNPTTEGVGTGPVTATIGEATVELPAKGDAFSAPVSLTKAGEATASASGPDWVTAGGKPKEATTTVTPGPATKAEVSVPVGETTPAGTEIKSGTATVTDDWGNPIPNTTVYYQLPGGEFTAATTDKDGKVTIPAFTPTAAGKTAVIVAKNADGTDELGRQEFTVVPGPVSLDPTADHHSTVDLDPTGSRKADGIESYTVKVTLVDAQGNPITLSEDELEDLALESSTRPDLASVLELENLCFAAGVDPGTYAVTFASITAISGPLTVTFNGDQVGEPLTVSFLAMDPVLDTTKAIYSYVEITPGARVADGKDEHIITIHMLDEHGNGVAGLAKDLSVKVAEKSARMARAAATYTFGEVTPVEGRDGEYTATMTSTKATTYPVAVSYLGNTVYTASKAATMDAVFVHDAPSDAVITGTEPAYAGSTVTPQIAVTDAQGNPTGGEDVWVKIGTGDPIKVRLDENGKAVLDGKDGRPGAITLTEDTTVSVWPTEEATGTALGSETIKVRTSVPEPVNAVKDPATGDLKITGTVPGAGKDVPVSITIPGVNEPITGTTDEHGTFTVDVPAATAGDATEVTVTAGSGETTSGEATASVVDRLPQPADVAAIHDADAGKTTVTGTADGVADHTKVTITDPNTDEVIGSGEVIDGKFTVTLDKPVTGGTELEVTLGEGATASFPLPTTVVDKPTQPTGVKAEPGEKGATVSGDTTPGATVTITGQDGEPVTTTADGSGHFSVEVPGAKPGDELTVVATKDGLDSAPATVTVPKDDSGNGGEGGDGGEGGNGGNGGNGGSGNQGNAGQGGSGNAGGQGGAVNSGKSGKGGWLAKTGASVAAPTGLGTLLILTGGLSILAARRRRTR